MERNREIACEIIDIFENLLEEKNITIPSKDREGNEDESRIFGEEYYSLEEKITELLDKKEEL